MQGLNKPKEKQCQFDMLHTRHQSVLKIGVDIPILRGREFPPSYISKAQLDAIEIFSVRVGIHQLEYLSFLKDIKVTFPRKVIHINLNITKPEDLIEFQRVMVQGEYPMERIVLSTNLLGCLVSKDHTTWERKKFNEISYRLNRCLERFLSDSFVNVLECFEMPCSEELLKHGDN